MELLSLSFFSIDFITSCLYAEISFSKSCFCSWFRTGIMIFSKKLFTWSSDFSKVFANKFLKNLFISFFISFGSLISVFSFSSFLIVTWTALLLFFLSLKKVLIIFFPLHTVKFYFLFQNLLLYCQRFLQVYFFIYYITLTLSYCLNFIPIFLMGFEVRIVLFSLIVQNV